VKVGLILPMFSGDPQKVLAAAREGEALGYDGVFAFDHFFPPGAPGDRPALEAFTTLAAVATVTERVTLGTLVVRASVRPLGLLAKQASWLDAMSGGRFVLGIGTGDPIDRPEHEAYGIPELDKTERREHLEEALVALRALFDGGTYPGGRLVPALDGPLLPPARVPMWVGAQADPVVRIAARLADGWNAWGLEPEPLRRKVELLREAAEGRDVVPTWAGIVLAGADRPETEELVRRRRERGLDDDAWTGSAEELAAYLRSLEAAGAEWAVLVLAGPADRRALIAERVLPLVSGPSKGIR
jgi:alkanesulfonate monooxygenase SsuD/methylene tetrahydromethanopterin reductase-like flavin-dependent oxidoreductase (luciferase family)